MTTRIETYIERARRLKLDPTQVCVACGATSISRVVLPSWRFCNKHTDWEIAKALRCDICDFEVFLTCGKGGES